MSEPDAKTLVLIDHVKEQSHALQNGSKEDQAALVRAVALQGDLLCAMALTPFVTPGELTDALASQPHITPDQLAEHIANCPNRSNGRWKSTIVICVSILTVVLTIIHNFKKSGG